MVDDGQIADIGAGLAIPDRADVIDATGQVLLPGLVDLHTHLREPGREYAEDIETGSAAAALGGYTAVFAMANTHPVADSPVVTDHVWRRGQEVGLVDVHPVGAVTVGLAGAELTEMGMMNAGAAAVRMFSDDGVCVHDPLVMRRALEYATGLGVLIAQHAEEPRLTAGPWRTKVRTPRGWGCRDGPGPPRNPSLPATRCWPATRVPGCTSATPLPLVPSRS
ncbi:amidohydrolase family protein [Mycobacterium kansasii]|uniref:Amidohydrolase family protein n=1 Tax=Mycobacterium kansasii TaxID=1768 RepID=A0A1V3WGW1_MYCKA|nr:amidohydrolase family protein [Mycobacterium kansasii]